MIMHNVGFFLELFIKNVGYVMCVGLEQYKFAKPGALQTVVLIPPID